MPKNLRYLITSADKKTWKYDRPVVFLGEWCLSYDRKNILKNMDAIIAKPYGLSKEKKDIDYVEVKIFIDKIFPIFCAILNNHHGVNYSIRFWTILLGHWFQRYVKVIFNRFNTIEQCLQQFRITGSTFHINKNYSLTHSDSLTAIYALNDDRWNNALNLEILKFLSADIKLELIHDSQKNFTRISEDKLSSNILKFLLSSINTGLNFFSKDSDAFIANTYLPKLLEVKLQLALNQIPQIRILPRIKLSERPNNGLRENLTKEITGHVRNSSFEFFLKDMLFKLIPICYLEGFNSLNIFVSKQPWPNYPKFIFTSNNFDTNEVFKLWAAIKAENGIKYFVGQHGNNYCTYRYENPTIEELTSDKFITWGLKGCLSKHVPAFIFKINNYYKNKYNPLGKLLLIIRPYPTRDSTWDNFCEYNNYFTEQINFTERLKPLQKKNLIVRMHKDDINLKLNKFDSALKIDDGNAKLTKLISKSRLVIFSYDSTGLLENFSQNIPTLIFFQNHLDDLVDTEKEHYKLLADAGLLHFTLETLSKKIESTWDDINAWWFQEYIQNARKYFCDRYARTSTNPLNDLKEILLR